MMEMRDAVAESTVISTIICNPEFIHLDEGLSHLHFSDEFNKVLFWALKNLIQREKSISPLTLQYQMEGIPEGAVVLSAARKDILSEIVEKSSILAKGTKEDYKDMANIIKTLSERREIAKNINIYSNLVGDPDVTNRELIKKISGELETVHNTYIDSSDIYLYTEHVRNLWEEIVSKRNPDGTFGIPTKFKLLNEYVTYVEGRLILVTARAKEGKSLFGLNELYHKICMGKNVAYFDTEMPELDFTLRLLAHITKIPVKRLEKGGTTSLEEQQIQEAIAWIEKQPFTYINSFDWNEDKIYTKLKILQNKKKLDLFIYDYIKNNERGSRTAYDNYNYLGQMTNFLKNDIAVGLNVPVLTFAQLNKNYDIADSDQISRYLSTQIRWRKKTKQEIMEDGKECGTHKASIILNRDGLSMFDDEYIDFFLNENSLDISEARKQHDPHTDIPQPIR